MIPKVFNGAYRRPIRHDMFNHTCVLPNIKENIVSVWEYICDCETFCCDCLMFDWKDDNQLSVIQKNTISKTYEDKATIRKLYIPVSSMNFALSATDLTIIVSG